jgi:hypothetical protein
MSDEVRRIQRMIDEGKVTREEGKELMDSVAEVPWAQPLPPAAPMPVPAAPEIPASWIVWPLVSHGILLAAIVLTLTVVTPKFREICVSFGVKLPWVMTLIFSLSRAATKWGLLLVPALGAFLAGDLAVYVHLRRQRSPGLATLWWWGVSLVIIGTVIVIIIGLYPVLHLMMRVGTGAG